MRISIEIPTKLISVENSTVLSPVLVRYLDGVESNALLSHENRIHIYMFHAGPCWFLELAIFKFCQIFPCPKFCKIN
jgi:hypothetical protein